MSCSNKADCKVQPEKTCFSLENLALLNKQHEFRSLQNVFCVSQKKIIYNDYFVLIFSPTLHSTIILSVLALKEKAGILIHLFSKGAKVV